MHHAVLVVYVVLAIGFIVAQMGFIFAANQTDEWTFASAGDYVTDTAVEVIDGAASLKGQEYVPDTSAAAFIISMKCSIIS